MRSAGNGALLDLSKIEAGKLELNLAQPPEREHGILIVSIDPDGPAARAGLVIGDIVTAWNAQPLTRVRDVMRNLGPDSVGNTVDLQLLRGGAPKALKIVIGERRLE